MKIITFACNAYSDIAPAFHHLWLQHWPDCPHEMVYVTNEKRLELPPNTEIHYIKGAERAWAWRMRRFVDRHYQEEHLLLMMVDYLVKSMDTQMIAEAHQLCALPGIRHVRLRPMPRPQSPHSASGFGKIDKRARYALSLQPGIWETQVLYDLCDEKWDPWQCEIQGSLRVPSVSGDFLSVEGYAINHHNYYNKGRPQGVDWVKENVPSEKWPEAAK